MHLAIVDVQPCYHKWCGRTTVEISQLMEQAESVKMFWVGEDLSEDTEDEVKAYWYEAGATEWALDRTAYIEKAYGYLRPWMDNGVDHGLIVDTLKVMYERDLASSLQIPTQDFKRLCGKYSLIPDWDITIPEEPIFTPPFDLSSFIGKEWKICGGANQECLLEVELLLAANGVVTERIPHLVW